MVPTDVRRQERPTNRSGICHLRVHTCYLQIIDLADREAFRRIVRKHGEDRHAKGFTFWDQLVSMLFCHQRSCNRDSSDCLCTVPPLRRNERRSSVSLIRSWANWTAVNQGLSNGNILSLSAGPSDLYAGTAAEGVFRSTNNGSSWTDVSTGLSKSTNYFNATASMGSLVFVGASVPYGPIGDSGGVFRSTNNGATWTRAFAGLTRPDVWCLSVSGKNILAGTGSGWVYLSTDSGSSWHASVTGLARIADQRTSGAPTVFSLAQNYPNPFNPSTTIRYGLPRVSHVLPTVFNTLGQTVATLVNESEDAGNHDVRFDASGLASGVYFYRLQAGSFVRTKKLVNLR